MFKLKRYRMNSAKVYANHDLLRFLSVPSEEELVIATLLSRIGL